MDDKKWKKAVEDFTRLQEVLTARMVEFLNWTNSFGDDHQFLAEPVAESGDSENGLVSIFFLSTGEWHLFLGLGESGISGVIANVVITYGEIFNPEFEQAVDDLAQETFDLYLEFWKNPDESVGKVGDLYRHYRLTWITALMEGMKRVLLRLEDFDQPDNNNR